MVCSPRLSRVASWQGADTMADVQERLDAIEWKLDALRRSRRGADRRCASGAHAPVAILGVW